MFFCEQIVVLMTERFMLSKLTLAPLIKQSKMRHQFQGESQRAVLISYLRGITTL
jgi:hypothetical protein